MGKRDRWGVYSICILGMIVFMGATASRTMVNTEEPVSTPSQPDGAFISPRLEYRKNLREGILPIFQTDMKENDLLGSPGALAITASTPANWSKIAYQVVFDGQYEILVQDGGGQNDTRLTFDPANDIEPRFSPLATDIVFASDRDGDFEIYRMKADGSQLTKLTNNTSRDLKPVWSPDGSKIIFTSNMPYSGSYQIWSMNADGSGLMKLTSAPGASYYDPAWSPDGSQIAYVRVDSDDIDEIYVMNADGSNPHMVCNGHNSNQTYEMYYIADLRWGDYPNLGNRITFDYYPYGYYFSSLGAYQPSSGACGELYSSTQTLTDVLNGGYSPDGLELFISQIRWTESGGYLYLIDMRSYSVCLAGYGNCGRPVVGLVNSLLPDWKSFDLWPAESAVTPLPPYSRGAYPIKVTAFDTGPAGLANWQYRFQKDSEEWSDVYYVNPMDDHTYNLYASFGWMVTYQTRACDDASQCEPWSSDPNHQTQTQKYTWQISGSVFDNRGYPDLTSEVAIDPLPVFMEEPASANVYHAWMNSTGNHALSINSAGYKPPPVRNFDLNIDLDFKDYLSPKVNPLVNGNADTGVIDPWITSGSLPVAVSTIETVSGPYGFMLGADCGGICLEAVETLPSPVTSNTIRAVVMDKQKGIHLIAVEYQTDIFLYVPYYYYRSPEGVWSPKEAATPANNDGTMWLDIDPNGRLFLIIPKDSANQVYAKDPEGTWGKVAEILNESLLGHGIDNFGALHLITKQRDSYTYYHLYDRELTADGELLPPIELIKDSTIMAASNPIFDSENNLHLLYSTSNYRYYQIRNKYGIWEPRAPLMTGTYGYGTILTEADRIHFLGSSAYAYTTGGIVTPPVDFPSVAQTWANLLGPDGALWHFYTAGGASFRKLAPGQYWGNQQTLSIQPTTIFLDDQNIFHALAGFPAFQYYQSERAEGDGDATMTQYVTIPIGMNHPTLAFMEQISGGTGSNGSGLLVNIFDGESWDTKFSDLDRNHLWEHHWVDLSDYAGVTVGVQFKLDQKANDPIIHIDLDDISLGAWDTPLVESASLGSCSEGELLAILSGDDFQAGLSVYLDGIAVDPDWITIQDENTLILAIPSGFQPGTYQVTIMNPGGQLSPASAKIFLGCQSFLPLLLN